MAAPCGGVTGASPGFNFGPGSTSPGGTLAGGPEAEVAVAGVGGWLCARTSLGPEQTARTAMSAAAEVMKPSLAFARRGEVFRCVFSIIVGDEGCDKGPEPDLLGPALDMPLLTELPRTYRGVKYPGHGSVKVPN